MIYRNLTTMPFSLKAKTTSPIPKNKKQKAKSMPLPLVVTGKNGSCAVSKSKKQYLLCYEEGFKVKLYPYRTLREAQRNTPIGSWVIFSSNPETSYKTEEVVAYVDGQPFKETTQHHSNAYYEVVGEGGIGFARPLIIDALDEWWRTGQNNQYRRSRRGYTSTFLRNVNIFNKYF